MAASEDGSESSASSGFLNGLANDLASGSKPSEHHDEASSSSDDCADPLFRSFTPGMPALSQASSMGSMYAGKAAVSDESSRQPPEDEADLAPESDEGELAKRFAELEAAENLLCETEENPFKKRRHNEEAQQSPACPPMAPAENLQETAHGSGELQLAGEPKERLPPSEKVVEAFGVLGIRITYVRREVEKQFRRLAFKFHPDKVNPRERWQAAQQFRKIQSSKEVILKWLIEGDVCEDSDCSDVAGCVGSDEEASVEREGCGEGSVCGSVSDEGQDEMKVCGITKRTMADSRSPSVLDSDAESEDGLGAELVLETRSQLVSDTKFAMSLSDPSSLNTINTLRQQANDLQKQLCKSSKRVCSECFEAMPLKGSSDTCAKCRKEERELMRAIGGTSRQWGNSRVT